MWGIGVWYIDLQLFLINISATVLGVLLGFGVQFNRPVAKTLPFSFVLCNCGSN